MNKTDTNRRIVSLDNVMKNNIVYVDLSVELSESVFDQEYRKAARIIRQIIEDCKPVDGDVDVHCRNCKSQSCISCRYRDAKFCQQESRRKHHLTEFQTAVPFIGDRGTGKSSLIFSIMERLRNYTGNNPDAPFYLGDSLDEVRFITFDIIDANILKRTDDVMEIILSRMLTYLEELQPDCDFRDLYRQIDELHEHLCLVRDDNKGQRENYGLVGLQRVADSQNAIENFRKLVSEFIRTISVYKYRCHPCYLVIGLDDIDMYQASDCGMQDGQFALLEHIYSHMRIPGLIVLVSFNEHILKRTCNRHFEGIYFGSQKPCTLTQTEQADIDALTGQFLSKLFSQERRIYLPNYMLIDSADRSNLYVRPTLGEGQNQKTIAPFSSEQELTVKHFMLRLIAHRTGVYFDVAGTKKHFFEPRNLREVGELFQVIYSMEEIPKGENDLLAEGTRSRNRQELLNYLYNQFALRRLRSDEYEQFRNLSTLPLLRQDRTLVDWIRQQRMLMASNEDDFGYLAKSKEDRWRYSYGELLQNIYYSTRISRETGSRDLYFRKEFMYCILGAHSVLMTETIQAAKSRQEMLSLLGSSIAGRWANKMLPRFYHEDYADFLDAGSISLPVESYFDWAIPIEVQDAILKLYNQDSSSSSSPIRLFMEALVVAGMFFTSYPKEGLAISFDAQRVDNQDQKAVLYLHSDSSAQICFNVMNFAINLYNALGDEQGYIGYINYIREKLEKLGAELSRQLALNWEDEVKQSYDHLQKVQELEALSLTIPNVRQRDIREAKQAHDRACAWSSFIENKIIRQTVCKPTGKKDPFVNQWNNILHSVIRSFTRNIDEWQRSHGKFQIVLPVQNFDMMYNIVKRLADTSYHDREETAPVSEVYKYYVLLYKNVEEELRNQDLVYFGDQANGFSTALHDCIFYRIMTANENGKKYNPYVKEVLVSMIRATAGAQQGRRRNIFKGLQ